MEKNKRRGKHFAEGSEDFVCFKGPDKRDSRGGMVSKRGYNSASSFLINPDLVFCLEGSDVSTI